MQSLGDFGGTLIVEARERPESRAPGAGLEGKAPRRRKEVRLERKSSGRGKPS